MLAVARMTLLLSNKLHTEKMQCSPCKQYASLCLPPDKSRATSHSQYENDRSKEDAIHPMSGWGVPAIGSLERA